MFAALGAGFFTGRRGWLAGALSVLRGGALAAPVALLFSLFFGSILATQLHQAFRPQSLPIEEFNALISLRFPELLGPLAIAIAIGAVAGWVGERLLPTRR